VAKLTHVARRVTQSAVETHTSGHIVRIYVGRSERVASTGELASVLLRRCEFDGAVQFDVRLGDATGASQQFASRGGNEMKPGKLGGDSVDGVQPSERTVAHTDGDRTVERDDR